MSQTAVEIMSDSAMAAMPAAMPAIVDPVAIAAAEEAKALVQAATLNFCLKVATMTL